MPFIMDFLSSAVDLTIYKPEDYPIYRVNPILKIIYFFNIFLIGLAISSPWITPTAMKAGMYYQIVICIGQLIVFFLIGRPIIGQLRRNKGAITFVLIFIGLLNILLGGPYREGWDIAWFWWPAAYAIDGTLLPITETFWFMSITDLSLAFGINKTFYIINVMGAGIMLLKTTSPRSLITSLTDRGFPQTIAFVAGMTLRFIPLIADEMFITYKAHMVRGLELQEGKITQRLKNFVAIIPPLLIDVIKIVHRMGTVYESRGFDIEEKSKTSIIDTKLSISGWVMLFIEVLLTLFGIHILFSGGLEWIFSLNMPFLHPMPDTVFWFIPPVYFDIVGWLGIDWPAWMKEIFFLLIK